MVIACALRRVDFCIVGTWRPFLACSRPTKVHNSTTPKLSSIIHDPSMIHPHNELTIGRMGHGARPLTMGPTSSSAKGKMNKLQRPWPRWQWARTYSIRLQTSNARRPEKSRNTISRVRVSGVSLLGGKASRAAWIDAVGSITLVADR
jgi:hypothetical protein